MADEPLNLSPEELARLAGQNISQTDEDHDSVDDGEKAAEQIYTLTIIAAKEGAYSARLDSQRIKVVLPNGKEQYDTKLCKLGPETLKSFCLDYQGNGSLKVGDSIAYDPSKLQETMQHKHAKHNVKLTLEDFMS